MLANLDLMIQTTYYFFIILTTICFGSFLNVLIYRLPIKESIVKGRSHCGSCGHSISWYDNIPIVSYIVLRGKCRNCKAKISIRYLAVEIITPILSIWTFLHYGLSWLTFLSIIVIMIFIVIFFIDLKHMIIPDSLIIAIGILGIISLFIAPIEGQKLIINYVDKLIAIGVVALIILIFMLFEKVLKKELIGGGDLKLFIVVGLFMGWQLLLLGIVIGSIVGVIGELIIKKIINKKSEEQDKSHLVPFGPYLVTGFTIALLYGINIIEWYIGLF